MHAGDYETNATISTNGNPADLDNRESSDVVRKQDINNVLQQLMTITDQSLDEAQARYNVYFISYKLLY